MKRNVANVGTSGLMILLMATLATAIVAVALAGVWPTATQAASACRDDAEWCLYPNEEGELLEGTGNQAGLRCLVDFQIDWGDGSPMEAVSVLVNSIRSVPHQYAQEGLYTITITGTPRFPESDPECNNIPGGWDDSILVEVRPHIKITELSLNDIDNKPLRFLSTDDHAYFGGNTRIHGTITVEGVPLDELESLELEVRAGGVVVAKAQLSQGARAELLQPFGADSKVSISQSKLLFELPSAAAALLDSAQNSKVELRAVAELRTHFVGEVPGKADKVFGSVPKLVRYTRANRYPAGARDENKGGDDWALPTVREHADGLRNVIHGTLWGDFSNMNGGPFPPHNSHREGTDVDGDYAGYDARTAAVATQMLSLLRNPTHGRSIRSIFVSFNATGDPPLKCEGGAQDTDHSAFWDAIRGETVPAPGGGTRLATSVIRPVASHCRHFHIRFFPN
jgi:hypothetical protein